MMHRLKLDNPNKESSFAAFQGGNESKLDELKKEKKKRATLGRIDTAARELLSKSIAPSDLKKDQLVLLLQWHGIDTANINTNRKRLQKWLEIKDNVPPSVPMWTLEEEAEIAKLEPPDAYTESSVAANRHREEIAKQWHFELQLMSKEEQFNWIEICRMESVTK